MDEPFLPWWLVLLLGMWATALTLWRHPTIHREVRWWAGLAVLAYLGLIFLALGAFPRAGESADDGFKLTWPAITTLVACAGVALIAGVWLSGRSPLRSRRLAYAMLTFANAGVCVILHAPEIAIGLAVVGLLVVWQTVRRPIGSGSPSQRVRELFRLQDRTELTGEHNESWIVGLLGGVAACVLVGTIAYSLRYETTRPETTTRFSTLPSRTKIERTLGDTPGSKESTLDLAFGRRADLVILMAVLTFIHLAKARHDLPRPQVAGVGSDRSEQEGRIDQ